MCASGQPCQEALLEPHHADRDSLRGLGHAEAPQPAIIDVGQEPSLSDL